MSLAVQRCWRRSLCRQSHAANLSWDAGGGDSLKLLRLVFELEEMLKRQLPLELFDKRMRPSDMAEALVRFVQGGRGSQPVALAASNHRPAVERGDPRPLVFLFPGITSDEPRQLAFRIDLARRARFVTLDYPEWDELLRPDVDLDTVVELLQERVLAAAGDQPIHLVGYSFGGLVAFALARRLEASQRPPAFLAILDTDISEGAKDPRLTNAVANAGGAAAGLAARTARLPRFLRSGRVQQRLAFVLAKWLLAPQRRRLLRFLASWPAVSFANNFRFLLKRELRWGMRAEHGRAWRRLNPGTRLERTEVVLFRTPGTVRDCGRPDLGWGARAPDLRLVDVPGTHLSLFSDGNRPALVASFIDLLDQHSADDGRTRVRSE